MWAYRGLKSRGLNPLELIFVESLLAGARWRHWVNAGGAGFSVTLSDGRTIDSQDIRGVLNRLQVIPSAYLMLARPADRDYALQELTAFFLSWLYSLPGPVVNRPSAQGLAGEWRHPSEWVALSARAGLPAPAWRQSCFQAPDCDGFCGPPVRAGSTRSTLLVLQGSVIGASLPQDLVSAVQRLAALAGTELLGVDLARWPDGQWRLAGATPMPDLRAGGAVLLDALAKVLGGAS